MITNEIPYRMIVELQNKIDFENVGEIFVKNAPLTYSDDIGKFPDMFANSNEVS
jgi:hypothetical protein